MPLHGVSRTDDIGLGLCLMANSWLEMVGVIKRCCSTQVVSQAAADRWNAITLLLRRQVGLVGKAISSDASKWGCKCLGSSCLTVFDAAAADVLKRWAAEARLDLELRSKELRKKVHSGWKLWIEEQLCKGAGAVHRFTKREEPTSEVPVSPDNPYQGLSLGVDDILKTAKDEWAVVWERFHKVAQAPWRTCPQHVLDRSAPLPPITLEMLREAAKTLKKRNGLGCDSIHPRTLGWLSDEIMQGLADLLGIIEGSGIWPEQVSVILVAFFPAWRGNKNL
jgi:hypothetical protein